jgi:hypothetical protein
VGSQILLCCSLCNRFSREFGDEMGKWTLRLTFERVRRNTNSKFKEPIYGEIADLFEGLALLLDAFEHGQLRERIRLE